MDKIKKERTVAEQIERIAIAYAEFKKSILEALRPILEPAVKSIHNLISGKNKKEAKPKA